jgi:host factor-I protein
MQRTGPTQNRRACGLSKTPVNLQDSFLNQVRKDGVPVTIYLINGFQIKGMIRGFDNFTVVLESDGKQMMVYKHALSTITPMRNVNWNPETGQSTALAAEARSSGN